nr:MAG TPA: hypothetical protein [Caudoviricetes sp.]
MFVRHRNFNKVERAVVGPLSFFFELSFSLTIK